MKIYRFIVHITIVLFVILNFGIASAAEVVLNFGVYSSDKPTEMVKKFRPILNLIDSRMEELLGEPVTIRMQVSKTYKQGVDNLISGKVDFARFGPASYVEAKILDPNIYILAMESVKGKKIFHGLICIAKNSHIRKVSDLKGKRFAFGNERSTIGRYLSQLYLVKHGVHASDLGYYEYLDRHDIVASAVASGKFDAGALKESTFNKLVKNGALLKELVRFPNVTKPWIVRSGLSDTYVQALRKTLIDMDNAVGPKTINIKREFLPGDDSDYESVREAMSRNNEFFEPSISPGHRD